jgi:DNA-binding NtrC family response regulator
MAHSVLDYKRILAVDDEPDVLEVLKQEIESVAPHSIIDTATTFNKANELLSSWTYDLIILDIMGVRGFDLLERITTHDNSTPTAMLTAHSFSPESMKKSIELGARAYLPKEMLGAVVPFLEDVLTFEYGPTWRRVLKEIGGIFSRDLGPYWRTPNKEFWDKFESRIADKK